MFLLLLLFCNLHLKGNCFFLSWYWTTVWNLHGCMDVVIITQTQMHLNLVPQIPNELERQVQRTMFLRFTKCQLRNYSAESAVLHILKLTKLTKKKVKGEKEEEECYCLLKGSSTQYFSIKLVSACRLQPFPLTAVFIHCNNWAFPFWITRTFNDKIQLLA